LFHHLPCNLACQSQYRPCRQSKAAKKNEINKLIQLNFQFFILWI
jgi:hypothetical protein